MNFEHSERSQKLQGQVQDFFANHILPRNREWHQYLRQHGTHPPFLKDLQKMAREQGLWNLGLPELAENEPGPRLTNLEYAPLAEIMGRLEWASLVFNCQAPDVPNMMILQAFGTVEQKERWLAPLLEARTRSGFAMTEPDVASSDATNIRTKITREGDEYIINGHKWFSTGSANPDCSFIVLMGMTAQGESRLGNHSVMIVPTDTAGLKILRTNKFLGHHDPASPIGEIRFTDVRVPVDHLLGQEGLGFLIGQARLGPARVHHCMRAIGNCEVLIELMTARSHERIAFGRSINEYDTVQTWIALSRLELEQARLLVHKTAWLLDTQDHRLARREVSLIKVAVARTYQQIADRAIQVFGAMGVTEDTPIAMAFAGARSLRIGDGPDEVHLRRIFRLEPSPEHTIAESPYIIPFEGGEDDN
ncbi:MAG: acyl-CoA dehydrogenase [Deltaproteobacteria bacterium]|nr:acyl-CoA dehydrogenase [Deltaproteobacteria bacterium]